VLEPDIHITSALHFSDPNHAQDIKINHVIDSACLVQSIKIIILPN
jgi:hypothetical protein